MSEPDEAAVEAVALAIELGVLAATAMRVTLTHDEAMALAPAVLATPVVADAFADADTLAKVREIMADWKAGKLDLSDVPSDIADLLAGEA